jgi:uncharacterized protein involved in cysteine biosynthesis
MVSILDNRLPDWLQWLEDLMLSFTTSPLLTALAVKDDAV